jgi:hypothetical protein
MVRFGETGSKVKSRGLVLKELEAVMAYPLFDFFNGSFLVSDHLADVIRRLLGFRLLL